MAVLARACGHSKLSDFEKRDLTTWDYNMHRLSGVAFGGMACGDQATDMSELRYQVDKLTSLLENNKFFES